MIIIIIIQLVSNHMRIPSKQKDCNIQMSPADMIVFKHVAALADIADGQQ